MFLEVFSPNPKLQKKIQHIVWVELNTSVGNFVILPGHAPMILVLEKNSMVRFCLRSGKQEVICVVRGVAEVKRESVTLLLNE